jgi:hypothetical protein
VANGATSEQRPFNPIILKKRHCEEAFRPTWQSRQAEASLLQFRQIATLTSFARNDGFLQTIQTCHCEEAFRPTWQSRQAEACLLQFSQIATLTSLARNDVFLQEAA